ncbi:peptidyl-prolyl cis-trans isomerase [Sutterella sp.]|uniref:peptidylprolyl isomerase n=1 Tax=Sutterella sp. TaxID=1981025 RepID=UPI0026E0712C|nr:peptidyl-prolyl cis-trans isomerase [Sutterella sp.]MDO5532141.1 peptidyl-prolyl cis-trans isomerase [Sutterella sp.]
MLKTTIAAALALALASGAAMAEFKDFTVNGELITKAQQEALAAEAISSNPNPHEMIANPQIEEEIRQMMIEQTVMGAYARKQGLDKLPEVEGDIRRATNMVLENHAVRDFLKKNPVTEKDLEAQYKQEADRWGPEEYRVRHILVKTEAEAKTLLEQINKGASFAKTAAEKSLDEGSKDVGGILDWQSPSVYTMELANAIRGLKKGETAKAPVQSPAGFHIVKVEDIRPAELFPKFEDRKEDLRHLLMQRKVQGFIHEQILRADVKDVPAK